MHSLQVVGLDKLASSLKNVQKQVAFATSKALNNTALKVQNKEVTGELQSKLKIRSPWLKPRTKYGVNIRFSNKRSLVAVVGSQAPWLLLVEKGGTKHPPKKALPIPTSNIDTSRRRQRAEKPKQLIKSHRGFVLKFKKGGAGIFMRTVKGDIKALYIFKDSAKVDDILNFFEAGKAVVDASFLDEFATEFRRAMASAR